MDHSTGRRGHGPHGRRAGSVLTPLRSALPTDLRYHADGWLMDGRTRGRAYVALRHRRATLCTERTDLVIEGFPRSANTYAYVAFWIANGRDIDVAHHTHAGHAVWQGVQRALPVIVLVRDPLDAVSSWLQFRPDLSARTSLRAYLRFNRLAADHLDRIVVAPFDTVVTDFGAVTDAVNDRFGTHYRRYVATADNEARICHETEWWDVERSGGRDVLEHTVSRPSAERRAQRDVAQARVRFETDLLERATDVYRQLAAHGVRPHLGARPARGDPQPAAEARAGATPATPPTP